MSDRVSFGNRRELALTAVTLESDTACQIGQVSQRLYHSLSDRLPWHENTRHATSLVFCSPSEVYSQFGEDILHLSAVSLPSDHLTYKSNGRIADCGDDTTWYQEDLRGKPHF